MAKATGDARVVVLPYSPKLWYHAWLVVDDDKLFDNIYIAKILIILLIYVSMNIYIYIFIYICVCVCVCVCVCDRN